MVFVFSRTSFAGIVVDAEAPQNPENPKPRSHRCCLLGRGDCKKLDRGLLTIKIFAYSPNSHVEIQCLIFVVAQRPDHGGRSRSIVREQTLGYKGTKAD
jgi:hypothetical protein